MPRASRLECGRFPPATDVEFEPVVTETRSDLGSPGIIAVGASLGGLRVIESILARLPRALPVPVVIVQHVSERWPSFLVDILRRKANLPVRWLTHGERLAPGVAYVAPAGSHAVVRQRGQGSLLVAPRVHHTRPAADPLLTSIASTYGRDAIAVVLTGRLSDGTLGALAVRHAGGVVIAQDPASCRAPAMPAAAMRAHAVHFVLPGFHPAGAGGADDDARCAGDVRMAAGGIGAGGG